jgi:hypothetical protein
MPVCGVEEKEVLEGTSAEEGNGQEPSVLLGCEGGGNIAQDIGEAIEGKCPWGRLSPENNIDIRHTMSQN